MGQSGVEWIGDVPEGWKRGHLKYFVQAIQDGTHGTYDRVDNGVPLLSAKNIGSGRLIVSENESLVSELDAKEILSSGFPRKGDVLFSCVGSIGKVCMFDRDEPLPFQRSAAFIRPSSITDGRFLMYALSSDYVVRQAEANQNKSAQAGIYLGQIGLFEIVLPPISEQIRIVGLLDAEIEEIDAAIDSVMQQCGILERYKSSLIHEAVTKGLDRDVPMRPSGVEWIGNIPEGWRALRGKYVFSMYGGSISEDHLFLEDRPGLKEIVYLKVSNLNNSTNGFEIDEYPTCYTDLAIEQFSTPLILIPKRGMAIQTNKVRISNRPCLIDPNLMAIRTEGNIRYYAYVLQCINLINIADVTTIPQINNKHLNELRLPVPSASEQKRIVDFLDDRCARIDRILDLKRRQVDVLRRRRQSLIYEYVTGKRRVNQGA